MKNIKKQIIAKKLDILHSHGVTIGITKSLNITDPSKERDEELKTLSTQVFDLKQEILNLMDGYELLLSDKVADIYVKQSN